MDMGARFWISWHRKAEAVFAATRVRARGMAEKGGSKQNSKHRGESYPLETVTLKLGPPVCLSNLASAFSLRCLNTVRW